MSISMHQACVPAVVKMLETLTNLLDKAQVHCAAKKIDEGALLGMRLYPDMFPLIRQFQIASDTAKAMAARLAGEAPPSFPDTETNINELKARMAKTIEFVKSVPAAKMDGVESKVLTIPVGGGRTVEMTGFDFLFKNSLPNFYFHATTAYDILRHCGLEIGKRNYLGAA